MYLPFKSYATIFYKLLCNAFVDLADSNLRKIFSVNIALAYSNSFCNKDELSIGAAKQLTKETDMKEKTGGEGKTN